jgi:hypothetical protein
VERAEDGPVRAALAQLRRLSEWRNRLRRVVPSQDAPDAVHIQFAKTIRLRLAFDRHTRRANSFDEVRIPLFNHHATRYAGGKMADGLEGQRISHPQLQHRGLRRRFPNMHERDPGSNNPERAVPIRFLVRPLGFVPFQDAGQLFPQATMGRPRIGGNHYPAFQITDEPRRGVGRR